MKNLSPIFVKAGKILLGIALGLIFSFVTIVCLEILLPKPNPFRKEGLNLWLIAPIIVAWLFFVLWLLLRKPSSKKIHTRGIEHLPNSASELIDGIIDAMKYRRSVRADVRQELVDHFTDALANCENEEQKQQQIAVFIEEFGDAELLGKLLRRAKKRCRPLWRTMAARTFQFIGVCVALLVFYIGWFFTGKPVVSTNYMEVMNRQVRPVADDSQNAWPYYKQAAEKRVTYPDEKFDFHPTKPSPFTRSAQDRQVIRQMISDNQDSLDLIRQGNQKPYYWQIYGMGKNEGKEMLSMLMPNLSDYKRLTYLMCWQGLLNAEQGDFTQSFDDLLEAYSLGQHLRGQNTTLIEQLVAMSIETISRQTLRMILAEYTAQIDVQTLDSARKQFAAMIDNQDFTVDFDSEKLFMHDEAQRCFTQSRFGKSHLYLPRLREYGDFDISDEFEVLLGKGLHVLFTHPGKEQTLREVERFYAEMEKIAAMTPASVKTQGLDIDGIAEEVMEKNVFLGILMPALGKVNLFSYRTRAETHATLAIWAVMQYEKEHGRLPETLDVLVNEKLLKEVPIDPFSDKSLVYHKTDDKFTLYSVGSNFTDDGGIPATNKKGRPTMWSDNGDAVFWPVSP